MHTSSPWGWNAAQCAASFSSLLHTGCAASKRRETALNVHGHPTSNADNTNLMRSGVPEHNQLVRAGADKLIPGRMTGQPPQFVHVSFHYRTKFEVERTLNRQSIDTKMRWGPRSELQLLVQLVRRGTNFCGFLAYSITTCIVSFPLVNIREGGTCHVY